MPNFYHEKNALSYHISNSLLLINETPTSEKWDTESRSESKWNKALERSTGRRWHVTQFIWLILHHPTGAGFNCRALVQRSNTIVERQGDNHQVRIQRLLPMMMIMASVANLTVFARHRPEEKQQEKELSSVNVSAECQEINVWLADSLFRTEAIMVFQDLWRQNL